MDLGGLTREYFRLLRHDVSSYIDSTGCFINDSLAFQVNISLSNNIEILQLKNNVYLKLGILGGMALCQGGGSFALMSPSVYKFMCGINPADLAPVIDEVSDVNRRTILKQVKTSSYFTFDFYYCTLYIDYGV